MERDERSLPEQPAALSRIGVSRLTQRRLGRRIATQEGGQVVGLEQDPVAIGHPRPAADAASTLLHRALDAPAQLLGFDGGTEEAADRPLDKAFEEPLERGQGWGHGVERI